MPRFRWHLSTRYHITCTSIQHQASSIEHSTVLIINSSISGMWQSPHNTLHTHQNEIHFFYLLYCSVYQLFRLTAYVRKWHGVCVVVTMHVARFITNDPRYKCHITYTIYKYKYYLQLAHISRPLSPFTLAPPSSLSLSRTMLPRLRIPPLHRAQKERIHECECQPTKNAQTHTRILTASGIQGERKRERE